MSSEARHRMLFDQTVAVDYHMYADPTWFTTHAFMFDDYPRNGTKYFVGEYAGKFGQLLYDRVFMTWQSLRPTPTSSLAVLQTVALLIPPFKVRLPRPLS